jgi:hypothetical protein
MAHFDWRENGYRRDRRCHARCQRDDYVHGSKNKSARDFCQTAMKPKPKKKYPLRCRTKRCRGYVASKDCHSCYCAKCKIRRWNEKYPLHRAFHNLRSHARERGKDFSLTLEQFKVFAEKTDYMKYKGKSSWSLSIDRKDNSKGYEFSNIQAITLRENSRKQYVRYWREYFDRTIGETSREIAEAYFPSAIPALNLIDA